MLLVCNSHNIIGKIRQIKANYLNFNVFVLNKLFLNVAQTTFSIKYPFLGDTSLWIENKHTAYSHIQSIWNSGFHNRTVACASLSKKTKLLKSTGLWYSSSLRPGCEPLSPALSGRGAARCLRPCEMPAHTREDKAHFTQGTAVGARTCILAGIMRGITSCQKHRGTARRGRDESEEGAPRLSLNGLIVVS